MADLLLFLYESSGDHSEVPIGSSVDVNGFKVRPLIHHGANADAGVGFGKAAGGKDVEIGIFFEPGFQVLGGDQVVGVVVHWAAVGPVEAGLHFVHGKQRVGLALSLRLLESRNGLTDSAGTHQRVCGVRHEVEVGGYVGQVVGQHQVH